MVGQTEATPLVVLCRIALKGIITLLAAGASLDDARQKKPENDTSVFKFLNATWYKTELL